MDLRKIIIDTDSGHDDALAIMLLEKSGMFDIKAITVVAGNSQIHNAATNARHILDLIGSSTPLYTGAEKPLKRELVTANVHGKGGLAGSVIQREQELDGAAVEKIIEIVRAYPGEVSILLIGPATNLAQAFVRDPELPGLIKEVVIMGGAISVSGNKNRVAEFNVFVDPDAADIVFRSSVKKVLVPLDPCNDISFSLEAFDALKGSALYEPLRAMIIPYMEGIQKFLKIDGALVYDPLAAYYFVNPAAFELEAMDIAIETEGETARGMTAVERRPWREKNPNVDVVTRIDRDAFVRDFFDFLKR